MGDLPNINLMFSLQMHNIQTAKIHSWVHTYKYWKLPNCSVVHCSDNAQPTICIAVIGCLITLAIITVQMHYPFGIISVGT